MTILRLPSPSRVQGLLFQYLLAIYLTYLCEYQYKTYAIISFQIGTKDCSDNSHVFFLHFSEIDLKGRLRVWMHWLDSKVVQAYPELGGQQKKIIETMVFHFVNRQVVEACNE